MESETKRIRLDEVTLMRTILAVLIVFMHSFTCYQGGWPHPEGYKDIPAYMWIARISFAFSLEAFVFISGYLFAFQRITLKRTWGGIRLIKNKFKRLIFPSVLFSALYFPLFCEYNGVGDFLYSLLNGCGHMWFLPMLFWCFIEAWLLESVKIGDGWKIIFLACLNLFSFFSLPFQLGRSFEFLFYFYGGFIVYKYSCQLKGNLQVKHIIGGWIIFFVVFIIFRLLKESIHVGEAKGLMRVITILERGICHLIYTSVGTFVLYCTPIFYTQKHQLCPFTINLSSCCFGIYLFHQFLLKGLYYKTGFAYAVGPYWLPWLGFLLAALASYLLSSLFLKTKMGKSLIG